MKEIDDEEEAAIEWESYEKPKSGAVYKVLIEDEDFEDEDGVKAWEEPDIYTNITE